MWTVFNMPKLYIIDGNTYIHRAYHALPPLTTSSGLMVNAVYGFIRMLLKLVRVEKPELCVVCFDYPAKNFRHAAYPLYKATRKELEESLKPQMPIAREAVQALGMAMMEVQGFEADDLIATLAHSAQSSNTDVIVVTGDKDILQLVNDRIQVFNEQKNIRYGAQEVEQRYGVKPTQLLDMFALMGYRSNKCYIIPSLDLVVARVGSGPVSWNEPEFIGGIAKAATS